MLVGCVLSTLGCFLCARAEVSQGGVGTSTFFSGPKILLILAE